jgi:luciferase family oxidoreductase group 1
VDEPSRAGLVAWHEVVDLPLPLSVLDLTPVPSGSTSAQALRNTIELARAAEGWGYARYWLAEHHNAPGLASSSPEVMIGQVAAATARIRVGAGGIMLPNHAALHVAEAFRVLEALYPGRIDLGIGRAPGTDAVAAAALRRGAPAGANDFPAQLGELLAYGGEGFPVGHPYASVAAIPADVPLPPIWILGSSDYGAQVAAALGVGFAFARHLNPRGAEAVVQAYRDAFRPSARMPDPTVILAVSAIAAGAPERAERLATSMGLGLVRMRQGRPTALPSPEEAAAHRYTPGEQDQIRRYRRAQVLGDAEGVRDEILSLAGATGADEVMVMTMIHDHAERLRSYELIAAAFGTPAREPAAAPGAVRAN